MDAVPSILCSKYAAKHYIAYHAANSQYCLTRDAAQCGGTPRDHAQDPALRPKINNVGSRLHLQSPLRLGSGKGSTGARLGTAGPGGKHHSRRNRNASPPLCRGWRVSSVLLCSCHGPIIVTRKRHILTLTLTLNAMQRSCQKRNIQVHTMCAQTLPRETEERMKTKNLC